MGLYDETKKFEEMEEGIHATFVKDEAGITVKCSVNATGSEVRALVKSLTSAMAERDGVDVETVLASIGVEMMLDNLRKDK